MKKGCLNREKTEWFSVEKITEQVIKKVCDHLGKEVVIPSDSESLPRNYTYPTIIPRTSM